MIYSGNTSIASPTANRPPSITSAWMPSSTWPYKRAQLRHRIGVAFRRLGVHLGRRAAGDRLGHPQHRAADLQLLAHPVALAPGGGAAEPDIGAEPAPVPAGAHLRLVVAQAGEVDQADHLARAGRRRCGRGRSGSAARRAPPRPDSRSGRRRCARAPPRSARSPPPPNRRARGSPACRCAARRTRTARRCGRSSSGT